MMWYCNDCKESFETPRIEKEDPTMGAFVDTKYLEYGVCPHCGSDYIDERNKCAYPDCEKANNGNGVLCAVHEQAILKKIEWFKQGLIKDYFTTHEQFRDWWQWYLENAE